MILDSKPKARILVVDDEPNLILVLSTVLEREGYEVRATTQPAEAVQALRKFKPAVVITDLMMPGMSGLEVLEAVQGYSRHIPVIVLTAHGTVESAVQALKRGAFDFVSKPFERAELLAMVKKAIGTVGIQDPSSKLLGTSPHLLEVRKFIQRVAPTQSTVLITGESGTGKELVAFEIHRLSERASGPFVRINCAAIPSTLIESELFGFEKGAFTGAVASKPGRFELAHGGTLFLDEVGEMPLEMQVKLLRALQEHEFERVGGVQPIRVDVRIITATNRDLAAEVRAHRFREDLYYRLNVVPLHLAPLRERVEDLDVLLDHFLSGTSARLGLGHVTLAADVRERLRRYSWPGNIRQLENVIERMMVLAEGRNLTLADLPPEIRGDAVDRPADTELASDANFKDVVRASTQRVERDLIEKALAETEGNVTRAAEKLGLSRKGLQLKIKELGLRKEDTQLDEEP
jgi:two-component system response regulator AtoC